jgi:hypothetical protein
VSDLTAEIQSHLMKAVELSIAAEGNRTGNYALIVQATVNPDGSFIMPWQRYYSPPGVTGEGKERE